MVHSALTDEAGKYLDHGAVCKMFPQLQIARQQHYLANHDSLTGLLTARRSKIASKSLCQAQQGAGAVALLFTIWMDSSA